MTDRVPIGQLAGYLGISENRIRALTNSGTLQRNEDGTLELKPNVRAYCEHLRNHIKGKGGSGLAGQRERLAREQADALEMKNAGARRDLLPAKEVESMWGDACRMIRSRLIAMPGRLQQRLGHLTPHDLAVMDREISDTLTELADDPL
jgi:phage terminase Nu1 subunit (DNA packaging protein)